VRSTRIPDDHPFVDVLHRVSTRIITITQDVD